MFAQRPSIRLGEVGLQSRGIAFFDFALAFHVPAAKRASTPTVGRLAGSDSARISRSSSYSTATPIGSLENRAALVHCPADPNHRRMQVRSFRKSHPVASMRKRPTPRERQGNQRRARRNSTQRSSSFSRSCLFILAHGWPANSSARIRTRQRSSSRLRCSDALRACPSRVGFLANQAQRPRDQMGRSDRRTARTTDCGCCTRCQARPNHVCDTPRPEKLPRAFDLARFRFQPTRTKKKAPARLRFSDCPKADTSIRHRELWTSIHETQYLRMRTADGPSHAASRPRIVDWDNPLDHSKQRWRRIETKKLRTRCHCERLCWRKRPPHSGACFKFLPRLKTSARSRNTESPTSCFTNARASTSRTW